VPRVCAAGGAPCVSGAACRASLRGRSPNGTRAKAKRRDKCYKKVQNERADANCARAQESGGRGKMLVVLSVLLSRNTRVRTARYGSSRRRCSFVATAAPAWSQIGLKIGWSGSSGRQSLFRRCRPVGWLVVNCELQFVSRIHLRGNSPRLV
jgi:hypothetical protein